MDDTSSLISATRKILVDGSRVLKKLQSIYGECRTVRAYLVCVHDLTLAGWVTAAQDVS